MSCVSLTGAEFTIRLFTLFLLCLTSVTASDRIPQIPTFSYVALQEIWDEKPSQAMSCVTGCNSHGSRCASFFR